MATATGSDAILTVTTDPIWAGVKLKADFSSLGTPPARVQFLRGTTPVRSGDPAWAPGGLAYAYDHEAPLGKASTWTAIPLAADGTPGTAAQPVTVTVEQMNPGVDCWVKPIANPDHSVAFQVHTDQIEEGWEGRVQATQVVGRALPSLTWDRRSPTALSITFRTNTKLEKDALLLALDDGPALVQMNPLYGIDDFFAVPTTSSLKYFTGMWSQLRDVPTTFQPCLRPPTIDAPTRWPGRSYAAVGSTVLTYADRAAVYPTYRDIFEGQPATVPTVGYGAGTYGAESYGA